MKAPWLRRLIDLVPLLRLTFCLLILLNLPVLADTSKVESRTLAPFHAIEVSGSFAVKWSPGASATALVEAPQDLLPRIKTEVRDGHLRVFAEGSLDTPTEIKVTLTGRQLDAVGLAGSGTLTAEKIDGDHFKADLAGSGDILLSGRVADFSGSVEGSGNLAASHLLAINSDVSIAGSGDAHVQASGRVNGSVVGSGTVFYAGQPEAVFREVIGTGGVTAKP